MREASSSRLLAIWWLDGDRFIGPVEELDGPRAVQYGDYIQLDADHFEEWPRYAPPRLRGLEYDVLPRGRVMFNAKIRKFVVVGPAGLVGEPGFQSAIRSEYGLPQTTVFESDEHYG